MLHIQLKISQQCSIYTLRNSNFKVFNYLNVLWKYYPRFRIYWKFRKIFQYLTKRLVILKSHFDLQINFWRLNYTLYENLDKYFVQISQTAFASLIHEFTKLWTATLLKFHKLLSELSYISVILVLFLFIQIFTVISSFDM